MTHKPASQDLFFGTKGSEAFLRKLLQRYKATRILFVTGRDSFFQSGAAMFLADALGSEVEHRFEAFSTNPTEVDLENGVGFCHDVEPDCIVSIGGGSVLDMAKLINLCASTGQLPTDCGRLDALNANAEFLPLIAIPTTAGSGSEATPFAVMYRDAVKVSVEHPSMLPCGVILNPELTTALTPYQTACCGFDAFSQAVESFWAVGATGESRRYGRKALELCLRHLESAVLTPSGRHRSGMLEAAYAAGRAIGIAKTTAAHALSYPLTAHYGLPHGHAVAMMLPGVAELNSSVTAMDVNDPRGIGYVRSTMGELCGIMNCESPWEIARMIRDMTNRIGLTGSWRAAENIDLEEVRALIVQEVNLQRLGNNPRRLDNEMLAWMAGLLE